MKFINKLERKFGRFGIPNLTVYIIGCYVLGYFHGHEGTDLASCDMGDLSTFQCWRNRQSSDVSSGYLFLLLSDRYFTGAYLGNLPVYIVYFFGISVYRDRSGTSVCVYRWLCNNRRFYGSIWKHLHNVLYQPFYFPCICGHISGSAASAYVCYSDQDEMDGIYIWTFYRMGYCILS